MDARSGRRVVWVVAAVIAAAAPATARAADGFLEPVGCVAAGAPCTGLAEGSTILDGTRRVATTEDGQWAFSIGTAEYYWAPDVVAAFARTSDGNLTFAGCIAAEAGDGCPTLPSGVDALRSPQALSVVGRDVYVLVTHGVSHFKLSAGRLRFVDCIGPELGGCAKLPFGQDPFYWGVSDIAASPDGTSLYVTGDSGILRIKRRTDGTIAAADCHGGGPYCALTPTVHCDDGPCSSAGVNAGREIVVSPDGTAVYVASGRGAEEENLISHYRRRLSDGRLTYIDCIGQQLSNGCQPLPLGVHSMPGTRALAVTATGDLYSLADMGGSLDQAAVTHFRIQSDGSLRYSDCIGTGPTGCTQLPWNGDRLYSVRTVVATRDGHSIYASTEGGVVHLGLDGAGHLAYVGCVGVGVGCLPGTVGEVFNGEKISLSADGSTFYSPIPGRITAFARRATPPVADGAPPTAVTGSAYNIVSNTAQVHADVRSPDLPVNFWVEFGPTTSYGAASRADGMPAGGSVQNDPWIRLSSNGTTHFRVVARNGAGTTYGADRTVTYAPFDQAGAPAVDSGYRAFDQGRTGAVVRGTVSTGARPAHYKVEYGRTTAYGSTVEGDLPADYNGYVLRAITGLQPGTAYHYRLTASNADGTSAGRDIAFGTYKTGPPPAAPDTQVWSVTDIGADRATLRATVDNYGRTATYRFETATGINGPWTALPSAPIASRPSTMLTRTVTGLKPGTRYFVRVVATTAEQVVTTRPEWFTTKAG